MKYRNTVQICETRRMNKYGWRGRRGREGEGGNPPQTKLLFFIAGPHIATIPTIAIPTIAAPQTSSWDGPYHIFSYFWALSFDFSSFQSCDPNILHSYWLQTVIDKEQTSSMSSKLQSKCFLFQITVKIDGHLLETHMARLPGFQKPFQESYI